jgi:hypothetical protein
VGGEPLFAELALLRIFQKDGWEGVWVHGQQAGKELSERVKENGHHIAAIHELQRLVAIAREGGVAAEDAHGQEQPCLGGERTRFD